MRLILKHGRIGAAVLALALAVVVALIAWGWIGPFALITIPFVLPVGYLLFKSYVELVQIVVEMVH